MFNIVLCHPYMLPRKSLHAVVSTFNCVDVCLEVASGRSLIEKLDHYDIDMVIFDIHVLEIEGSDILKHLKKQYPKLRILLIAPLISTECLRLLEAKLIHGLFDSNSEPLLLENHIHNTGREPRNAFSGREIEILGMVCAEYSSGEIADKLCINVRTVESHRKRIMEKTGSKNFIGSIIFALKHRYISLPE